MSADGDISVAEALQQLKKRARDEQQTDQGRRPATVRPSIPWPEPPLPKLPKTEGGQRLPLQGPRNPPHRPVGPHGAGGPLSPGLRPPGAPSLGAGGGGPRAPTVGAAATIAASAPAPWGGKGLAGPNFGHPAPVGTAATAIGGPPGGGEVGGALASLGGKQASMSPLGAMPAGPGQAGSGANKVSFEIPQGKVGLLIGKQATTINAIKVYSKAHCFVEQKTPDEDQARVTIMGQPAEIDKCKQTINALISGMMNTGMLFQLAGLPLPLGEGAGQQLGGAAPGPSVAAGFPPALGAVPAGIPPGLPSGMPSGLGLGGPAGMPVVPPPHVPQDTQIQEKLNEYYAQWWSQYTVTQQSGADMPQAGVDTDMAKPMPQASEAFDKEALARLAEQASKAEEEAQKQAAAAAVAAQAELEAQAKAAQEAAKAASPPPLVGDLTERATLEVRQLLEGAGFKNASVPDAPSQAAVAAPATQLAAIPAVPTPSPPTQPIPEAPVHPQAPSNAPSNGLFSGFSVQGPQRAQKDNDSVMKMLQRMQGNVLQAKMETKAAVESHAAPRPPRFQDSPLPDVISSPPSQDIRPPVDPEWEMLLHRVQNLMTGRSSDLPQVVVREVGGRLASAPPEQILDLLQKLDGSPERGPFAEQVLLEVSRGVAPRLREFTGTQFTSLLNLFTTWAGDSSTDLHRHSMQQHTSFFSAAAAEMSSRLMEFAPHEINCCLVAFLATGTAEMRFVAQVGRAALARHSSFGASQLTSLLALLAEVRLTHLDLFNAAAQFIGSRARELRKVDILRLARSFAKCNIRCEPLFQALGDEATNRQKVSAKGNLEKGDSVTFTCEELCELAWVFCVVQTYHEELFRTTLNLLEQTPRVATDALCMLHEVHLVLDTEHKDAYSKYRVESEAVQGLLDHYREHRKDVRRCSEKARHDVSHALKHLVEGSVSVNHRTSTGLLVDVAALRKRSSTDGFIHVELDSSMSMVRALDQEDSSPASALVEGSVALKRRILEKHGLVLVVVRESEWRKLEDSREKRRHLRSLLSSLNDVLE